MRSAVSDVMTKKADVVFVREATPFKDIVECIERFGVTALPVLAEDERVVGLVSEADLLLKQEGLAEPTDTPLLEGRRHRVRRQKAGGIVAADVMSKPVETISPTAFLTDAARAMDKLRIKRLVVTDDAGRLQGVVSRRDLLKVFLRSDQEIADEIAADVLDQSALPMSSDVDFQIRNGMVTVEGVVELRSLKIILVQLLARVEGVVHVEDHLEFRVDDRVPAR